MFLLIFSIAVHTITYSKSDGNPRYYYEKLAQVFSDCLHCKFCFHFYFILVQRPIFYFIVCSQLAVNVPPLDAVARGSQ